jgi:hypothetical protein
MNQSSVGSCSSTGWSWGKTLIEQGLSGNPLWLLGVDAPTGQKSFFKMFKNSEKNCWDASTHFYVHSPSFVRKKYFLGPM